jgi:3-isopropylmalate/(R)-2-methylmalate dehydratase small subunit
MSAGRAWVFGDDINTDLIAPARYLKRPVAEFAVHTMEAADPEFASGAKPGDILVGGENFGCGSSREQAPAALRHLGLAAVVAKSFARTFYRNSMNVGLPVLVCPRAGEIKAGARLQINLEEGVVEDVDNGTRYSCNAIPPHLMQMIRDGGLIPHLEKRLKAQAAIKDAK